jgi:hypothetical protein
MSSSPRVLFALISALCSYGLWRYIRGRRNDGPITKDRLLIILYVLSRVGGWLIFTLFLQRFVTSSDPQLFYTMHLEDFLSGGVPVRDFYYPYGPLLIPSMLPFYLLLGRSLAGISLYAILAEAVALWFFIKSARLAERCSDVDYAWVQNALALYILNPATLYWTVLLGYQSIVQTAYSMVAFYFLLRGRHTLGYAIGLLGLAGTKLLMVLDWPALPAVTRLKIGKLFVGTLPLLAIYGAYQWITGDSLFPFRYYFTYESSEGNVWYLLTLFGDPQAFYSIGFGSVLSLLLFTSLFFLGFGRWLWLARQNRAAYSFPTALGISTFTMGLFFICSRYTGNYYVPMMMLPACMVATRPGSHTQGGVWPVLLISSLCIVGDAVWSVAFNQPRSLIEAFSTHQPLVVGLWTGTIVIRLIAFAMVAYEGLFLATRGVRLTNPVTPESPIKEKRYAE